MKILYIASHLSTGGMPELLLTRIKSLKLISNVDVWVVEYATYSVKHISQRSEIQHILGSKFISLGGISENTNTTYDKYTELRKLIESEKFDIIHFDDIPDTYDSINKIHMELLEFVYKSENKHWKVVETSHTSTFNGNLNKRWIPDAFMHCSSYSENELFSEFNGKIPTTTVEYPIYERTSESHRPIEFETDKFNIINVGIWTPDKNQRESVEIARYINDIPHHKDRYIFHFIGPLADNFSHYWQPILDNLPSNVRVWNSQSDMDRFYKWADIVVFNSTNELNPIVLKEAVSFKKPILMRNLSVYNNVYNQYASYLTGIISVDSLKLLSMLDNPTATINYNFSNLETMGNDMINFYTEVLNENKQLNLNSPKIDAPISFSAQFVDGAFVEIIGEDIGDKYKVEFIDLDTNKVKYYVDLNTYNWAKPNFKYYINWLIKITPYNTKYKPIEYKMNLTNMRVLIEFKSSSLGDTIAWIPYVEEFRKKHNCTVFCSTHHNDLFKNEYTDINFIKPGETVFNLYAKYDIGWFYKNGKLDTEYHKFQVVNQPLQKTVCDILGLDYMELTPKVTIKSEKKIHIDKYFTFSIQSTAQSKYWNNPTGWTDIIDMLGEHGYTAVCVDYHSSFGSGDYMNTIPTNSLNLTGMSLFDTIDVINDGEFHIGISSGLSWLAWAIGKPVVMISGFTDPILEFKNNCVRIHNNTVCNGCFTNPSHIFDKSDWGWCPVHNGTNQQFECSKVITATQILNEIKGFGLIK
jgi:autotransporter strand-loop-strand O-heptosyltransferase